MNWEEAFAEDDSELPGERPEAQADPLGEGDDFYFTTEDPQAEEEPDFLSTQEESTPARRPKRRAGKRFLPRTTPNAADAEAEPEVERGASFFPQEDPQEDADLQSVPEETDPAPPTEEEGPFPFLPPEGRNSWDEVFAEDDFEIPGDPTGT